MIENEDRVAERESRRHHLTGEMVSAQSARAIASWFHGGAGTRAYSFASTGIVQPDLDRDDFVADWEYDTLDVLDQKCIDALMAYIKAEKLLRHVDYPHKPGALIGCAECEACCHCESGGEECVRCQLDVLELCGCSPDGSSFCYEHAVAIERFSRD